MAKPASIQIKLVSTADTGFYYVTKKNQSSNLRKDVANSESVQMQLLCAN